MLSATWLWPSPSRPWQTAQWMSNFLRPVASSFGRERDRRLRPAACRRRPRRAAAPGRPPSRRGRSRPAGPAWPGRRRGTRSTGRPCTWAGAAWGPGPGSRPGSAAEQQERGAAADHEASSTISTWRGAQPAQPRRRCPRRPRRSPPPRARARRRRRCGRPPPRRPGGAAAACPRARRGRRRWRAPAKSTPSSKVTGMKAGGLCGGRPPTLMGQSTPTRYHCIR